MSRTFYLHQSKTLRWILNHIFVSIQLIDWNLPSPQIGTSRLFEFIVDDRSYVVCTSSIQR